MNKIVGRLKEEFFEVLPPTIFFFFAFNILALTRALMLKQYGIEFTTAAGATVGALVVGKVVLVADKLPLINRFPEKPLMYNVVWKTVIYVVCALLVRAIEHLLPFLFEYGSFGRAIRHLMGEVVWPHFWAVQIWLLVLFLAYCSLRELIRAVGRQEVIDMFFRQPPGLRT
jgi:hypothetical protein